MTRHDRDTKPTASLASLNPCISIFFYPWTVTICISTHFISLFSLAFFRRVLRIVLLLPVQLLFKDKQLLQTLTWSLNL